MEGGGSEVVRVFVYWTKTNKGKLIIRPHSTLAIKEAERNKEA